MIGRNCQPGYWDENFGPKSSNCFEYNRDLKVFELIVKKYKDEGFDVNLNFNCEDCQKDGYVFLEFELKIGNEVHKSYPLMETYYSNTEICTPTDYNIVLEFLKGTALMKNY